MVTQIIVSRGALEGGSGGVSSFVLRLCCGLHARQMRFTTPQKHRRGSMTAKMRIKILGRG